MKINSIGNLNFGLKFSDGMYEILNEGRQAVAKRNSGCLKHWASIKKSIKDDLFDDTFVLHCTEPQKGDKTIFLKDLKEKSPIEKDPGSPVMTLKETFDETLDMAYIINLKNLLSDLKPKYQGKNKL